MWKISLVLVIYGRFNEKLLSSETELTLYPEEYVNDLKEMIAVEESSYILFPNIFESMVIEREILRILIHSLIMYFVHVK